MILVEGWVHRSTEQTENPEINLYIYSQLIFDKGTEAILWRYDSLFNGARDLTQKNELQINLDLNEKYKIIKLLEYFKRHSLGPRTW